MRLIADGLWLSELMNFAPPDDDLRQRIVALAQRMTEA